MNPSMAQVSLAWSSVYAGLSAFFLVVAPRFRGRGYDFLGAAMGLVALSSFGTWLLLTSGPSTWALVGGRLLLFGAAFAPPLNTQFVLRFSRELELERFVWLGYVLALAAVLADGVLALSGSHDLEYPRQYVSRTAALSIFLTATFAAHLLACVAILWKAVRRGYTQARFPLLLLGLMGPAIVFDFSKILGSGENYFITEGLTWLYGLVVVAALLSELRGAEGLLEKTTSSLAERTAELQSSYAEIELMHTELTQKEQLAAVGELAASIAHEVRNPLAIIMNAASGLRRKTLSDEDKATLLSIVDEESARLNQLVTELLRFARPVTAARAPGSLVDICEQVQRAAPQGYEVRVKRPKDLKFVTVSVDPGLFRLALDNLVLNATQAMPGGGTVHVEIRPGKLSDGAPAAAVDVVDTGPGMTPAEVDKAKKPFFTTRPRGTGLGLPITQRILDAHGGEMAISSIPGAGTRVTLLLPLDVEEPQQYPGSKSPSHRRRMRSFPSVTVMERSEASAEAPPEAPAPPRDWTHPKNPT